MTYIFNPADFADDATVPSVAEHIAKETGLSLDQAEAYAEDIVVRDEPVEIIR